MDVIFASNKEEFIDAVEKNLEVEYIFSIEDDIAKLIEEKYSDNISFKPYYYYFNLINVLNSISYPKALDELEKMAYDYNKLHYIY